MRIRWSARTTSVAVLIMASLLGPIGCGPPTGTVTGTVKYKGQHVRRGTISFMSREDLRSVSAAIQEDGSYEATDVPVGDKIVLLFCPTDDYQPSAEATRKPTPSEGGLPPPPAGRPTKPQWLVPLKYASKEQTDLRCKVEKGANEYPIDLK